jgi:hypothetical protein
MPSNDKNLQGLEQHRKEIGHIPNKVETLVIESNKARVTYDISITLS